MKKQLSILFLVFAAFLSACDRPNQQPYRAGILTDEFIYDTASFPSVHAATIAETPAGLISAFFGGSHEGNPDVCIFVSRHIDGKWSEPVQVADGIVNDTLRKACYNPVLHQVPGGELLLFYKIGKNVQDWSGYLIRSNDNGATWSRPEALPDGFLGPIKNRPEQIGDYLVCPSSTEDNGWRVHFEYTPDFGKTWAKTEAVNDSTFDIIQPSILRLKDGRYQMLCRSRNEQIISAYSTDGIHWDAPFAIEMPQNNSGTDAVTLNDGSHLLVYNHKKLAESWDKPQGRSPLNVAVSNDGFNWNAALILEDSPISEYSYPSVICGSDGLVHIVYTWRREKIRYVAIDPSKLQTKPIIDEQWPE